MEKQPDNVVYIDEYKRARWLYNLRVSRELSQLGVMTELAIIIPIQRNGEPDDAA